MSTNKKKGAILGTLLANKKVLLLVLLVSCVSNVLMLTEPLFMLQVYDRVLASQSEETLLTLFLLVVGLYLIYAMSEYARTRMMARIGARMQQSLDERVFIARLQAANRTSITNESQNLAEVQNFVSSPGFLAIMDIAWTPLFLLVLFAFHSLLGWLAIAGLVVLIVVTILNQIVTSRTIVESRTVGYQASVLASEIEQQRDLVVSQSMLANFLTRWSSLRTLELSHQVRSGDWSGVLTSFSKSFRLLLQSAMLAVGAYLVIQTELTAGAMIAGSILLGRALAPVEQTLGQWAVLKKVSMSWKAVSALLENATVLPDPVSLPKPAASVTVSDVTVFAKGRSAPLLRQISLTVEPGEAVGVVGPSGAGKSVLSKVLLGSITPTSGRVYLSGAPYEQYSAEKRGEYIGYLPQEVTLFAGTIAENIARMSVSFNDEDVISAARKANVDALIESLDQGYNTVINPSNSTLSGGEKQRIALARALYGDPILLILDEPNSALDKQGIQALNATILSFKEQGKSVVIMTHRRTGLDECDRLILLREGSIDRMGAINEK